LGRISETFSHFSQMKPKPDLKCCFCGEVSKRGGFWVAHTETFVCTSCAESGYLGALLGDAVFDSLFAGTKLQFWEESIREDVISFLNHVLAKNELRFWKTMFNAILIKIREEENDSGIAD